MPSGVARVAGLLLLAACLGACSVTRQRVDLSVRGDVPAGARKADSSTYARRITAAFRCPSDGRGDHGPQYCAELGERPDREIVGGPLGVAASVLPGVECADLCTQRRISIEPIMARLGRPPDPAEIARRVAPSGPANARVRDNARRAYEEAVRSRYRSYAQYLSQELSDADYVEIGPVSGGGRRYYSGSIYVGVAEAFNEMADRYASLEWSRFEREWARAPATGTRGTPARSPESPAAPAEKGEEPLPTPPAATPGPVHQADKPSAPPAPTPIAEADQVRCRRSCSLRYRACLARCRDQPVTGGGYDACAYECSDGSVSCRGACGGALASP
jgi:hypothetical protein